MIGFVCVTERDEATTEPSNHNVTSFTEVDKRVKRRLLMGNNFTPIFKGKQLELCVVRDGRLSCQELLRV